MAKRRTAYVPEGCASCDKALLDGFYESCPTFSCMLGMFEPIDLRAELDARGFELAQTKSGSFYLVNSDISSGYWDYPDEEYGTMPTSMESVLERLAMVARYRHKPAPCAFYLAAVEDHYNVPELGSGDDFDEKRFLKFIKEEKRLGGLERKVLLDLGWTADEYHEHYDLIRAIEEDTQEEVCHRVRMLGKSIPRVLMLDEQCCAYGSNMGRPFKYSTSVGRLMPLNLKENGHKYYVTFFCGHEQHIYLELEATEDNIARVQYAHKRMLCEDCQEKSMHDHAVKMNLLCSDVDYKYDPEDEE